MEARNRKRFITAGKILLSAVLLYFIFTKIPFRESWEAIEQAIPVYLFLALILFVVSKLFAAFRLNLFFHQIGIPLSAKSNLQLYLQGMFYNLFLPGGIGGDAYKGYLLQTTYGAGTRKIVSSLLIDRLSGLFALLVYAGITAIYLQFPEYRWLEPVTFLLLFSGITFFWLTVKKYFKYLYPVFWQTLLFAALVQFCQILAVWCLLLAFGISDGLLSYILVFLISSIVAVIPITIGGVGSRELVFYYGAEWMGLRPDVAIGLSLLFFAITAVVSFAGVRYHFKKPTLRPGPPEKNN